MHSHSDNSFLYIEDVHDLLFLNFSFADTKHQVQESNFIVDDIYTLYKGEKIKKVYNTVVYFEVFLEHLRKLLGIDLKQVTWNKFFYVKQHVKAFVKWKYKRTDYPLKDLKLQFLHDFEYYLKVEKKQAQITINKSIQRFRKPIKVAMA